MQKIIKTTGLIMATCLLFNTSNLHAKNDNNSKKDKKTKEDIYIIKQNGGFIISPMNTGGVILGKKTS